MNFTVRLRPGDARFEIGPHESILEAALSAGYAVNYGCSNGKCGLCKARLISGELREHQHHDFHFSEAERSTGYFLMCAHGAGSDLEIEATQAHGAAEIPEQQLEAKLRRLDKPTEDIAVLRLRPPRTQRLRFLAGQYARLSAGPEISAEVSIASCPCDDLNLEFHIQRHAGESFAEYVFEHLKPGDRLLVDGPAGNFLLDEESRRDALMIAVGAGFGPIKSLIEHAIAQDEDRGICLVWVGSAQAPRYMGNLCRSWADALDNFRYLPLDIPTIEASTPESRVALAMGLEDALVRCPDLADRDAYASGPSHALTTIARALQALGLPAERIRVEPLRERREATSSDDSPSRKTRE
jgi:CDP-4-dehydro-6-deoxyglucose reductase